MKKELQINTDHLKYQIQYLSDEKYFSISKEDKESLNRVRNLIRYISQHEKWFSKNQKVIDDISRRKSLIRNHTKELREVVQEVSLLKTNVTPIITIYKKDESSNSFKENRRKFEKRMMNKTYGGKPIEKRVVWSSTIRMVGGGGVQKNIYLGSDDRVREVLKQLTGNDPTRWGDNRLKNTMMDILKKYLTPHLKDGWESFIDEPHPFHDKIFPWLMERKEGS
jgi:hypothetical protein